MEVPLYLFIYRLLYTLFIIARISNSNGSERYNFRNCFSKPTFLAITKEKNLEKKALTFEPQKKLRAIVNQLKAGQIAPIKNKKAKLNISLYL